MAGFGLLLMTAKARTSPFLTYWTAADGQTADVELLAEQCGNQRAVALEGDRVEGDAFNLLQQHGSHPRLSADAAGTDRQLARARPWLDQVLVALDWRVLRYNDNGRSPEPRG